MAAPRKSVIELLDYVSKGWFPVNLGFFKNFQSKLKAGKFDNDRAALIRDLKGDFSVFGYCLKKLSEIVPKNDRSTSPTEILRKLDFASLKRILEVSDEAISGHSFDSEMKLQAQRIKHCLVSTSAAETLSLKANYDSDLVYSCALVRQLGLNLVAWNYPRIYASVADSLKGTDSSEAAQQLEAGLTRILGISPSRLGIESTVAWNTCPEFMLGLGVLKPDGQNQVSALSISPSALAYGTEISKHCGLGERLARLADPEHYPTSGVEWSAAMQEVQESLGTKGISLIRSRLDEYGAPYANISKSLFKVEISQEKSLRSANQQHVERLLSENLNLRKLPEDIQKKFRIVYDQVVIGQVSPGGINALVSMLIPAVGFTRGCIYLVDPVKMLLVPTLRVGDTALSRYRALNCADAGQPHPAADALNYSMPIVQENVVLNGELVSHISGTFGNAEKTGVLFLEMSKNLLEAERQVSLMFFKAIKQCLNDCLNLR